MKIDTTCNLNQRSIPNNAIKAQTILKSLIISVQKARKSNQIRYCFWEWIYPAGPAQLNAITRRPTKHKYRDIFSDKNTKSVGLITIRIINLGFIVILSLISTYIFIKKFQQWVVVSICIKTNKLKLLLFKQYLDDCIITTFK